MICKNCGNNNEIGNNFCSNCGSKLTKRNSTYHKSKKQFQKKDKQPKTLNFADELKKHKIILVSVVVIALFFLAKSFQNNSNYNNLQLHSKTDNIILTKNGSTDSLTTAIANKFICSCGKCEDSLTICDCQVATDERNFIQNELGQNKSVNYIVTDVTNKYGHLKS
jgi:cytochrome c-type biogenesis protein CcmH/NrfF